MSRNGPEFAPDEEAELEVENPPEDSPYGGDDVQEDYDDA